MVVLNKPCQKNIDGDRGKYKKICITGLMNKAYTILF